MAHYTFSVPAESLTGKVNTQALADGFRELQESRRDGWRAADHVGRELDSTITRNKGSGSRSGIKRGQARTGAARIPPWGISDLTLFAFVVLSTVTRVQGLGVNYSGLHCDGKNDCSF